MEDQKGLRYLSLKQVEEIQVSGCCRHSLETECFFSDEFVISYLFNIYFIDQKKQWSIRGTLFVVILASALRKHRNTDCLLTNRQMIGIRNVFSFILLYFTDELKVCKFLTRSTKLQFNLLWAGVNKDIYKMRL